MRAIGGDRMVTEVGGREGSAFVQVGGVLKFGAPRCSVSLGDDGRAG